MKKDKRLELGDEPPFSDPDLRQRNESMMRKTAQEYKNEAMM
jgi:hypothetical protein